MCSFFAETNGVVERAGSSAIEMFFATRLPFKMEKLRCPRETLRPSKLESSFSILGLNVSALMKRGMRATKRMKTPTMPRSIFTQRLRIELSFNHKMRTELYSPTTLGHESRTETRNV